MAIAAALVLPLGATSVAHQSSGAARQSSSVAPARCPIHPPQQVRNRWSATRSELAPKGAREIRLCRYSKVEPGSGSKLLESKLVRKRATVDELVNEFDQLVAENGAYSCPADLGSQILARLAYPDRHRDTISVDLSGCQSVSNGHLFRTAASAPGYNPAGARLASQLRRLTR